MNKPRRYKVTMRAMVYWEEEVEATDVDNAYEIAVGMLDGMDADYLSKQYFSDSNDPEVDSIEGVMF